MSGNATEQAVVEGFSLERHGPWAVIAGASDGLGAEFARHAAADGIHCVLIARRLPALQALASELTARYGVEAIPISLDLSTPDATKKLLEAIGNREIGLLVFNAGADTSGKRFHDLPLTEWEALVRRNVNTFMSTCYSIGERMKKAGHGGMLLVSSIAVVWRRCTRRDVYGDKSIWSQPGRITVGRIGAAQYRCAQSRIRYGDYACLYGRAGKTRHPFG